MVHIMQIPRACLPGRFVVITDKVFPPTIVGTTNKSEIVTASRSLTQMVDYDHDLKHLTVLALRDTSLVEEE